MPNNLVSLTNVAREYKKADSIIVALKPTTCSIMKKDRIAIMGSSGSGKSTLLHLIGALDKPSSGEITWGGLDTSLPLRPNQIGFIFQMQSLLPTLNVLENVELPLLLMNKPKEESRQIALETLKHIELDNLAEKLPDELSGGQAQRIAIARVLAYKPKIILADEPTGQLDHVVGKKLMDTLLSYIEDTDIALVIATHDIKVAQRMNTIWTMQHGTLEVQQ